MLTVKLVQSNKWFLGTQSQLAFFEIDHEIPDSNPELLYIFHLRQSTCLTGGKWWGIQGVQLLQKDIDILA